VSDKSGFLAALAAVCEKSGPPSVFVNNAGIAKGPGASFRRASKFEEGPALSTWTSSFMGLISRLSRMGSAREAARSSTWRRSRGICRRGFHGLVFRSKFAVVGFTRALQAELEMAHSPVKVLPGLPGIIDTRS